MSYMGEGSSSCSPRGTTINSTRTADNAKPWISNCSLGLASAVSKRRDGSFCSVPTGMRVAVGMIPAATWPACFGTRSHCHDIASGFASFCETRFWPAIFISHRDPYQPSMAPAPCPICGGSLPYSVRCAVQRVYIPVRSTAYGEPSRTRLHLPHRATANLNSAALLPGLLPCIPKQPV